MGAGDGGGGGQDPPLRGCGPTRRDGNRGRFSPHGDLNKLLGRIRMCEVISGQCQSVLVNVPVMA